MNAIVCLDDNMGMLFNRRRQSQDKVLRQHICQMAADAGSRLLMNTYSGKMFAQDQMGESIISDDFLEKALPGDFCFVENESLEPVKDNIETLVIYRWNRKYPADVHFDLNLDDGWVLMETKEFQGSSHEKITEEIYTKAGQN